jgi:hypothetical protein
MSTLNVNTINPVQANEPLNFQTGGTTFVQLTTAGSLSAQSLSATQLWGDGSKLSNLPGGGKILQVVSAFTNTAATFSSAALLDTGLQVLITPSSTSSKIFISAMLSTGTSHGSDNIFAVGLRRGSTDLGLGVAGNNRARGLAGPGQFGDNAISTVSMSYMDTPSSTSELTYKATCSNRSGYTSYMNRTGNDTDAQYTARPSSTITVWEIAG